MAAGTYHDPYHRKASHLTRITYVNEDIIKKISEEGGEGGVYKWLPHLKQNTLIFFPCDEKQNYSICRFKFLVKEFGN